MSIKLNNFVNIDIKYDTTNSYVSSRDTAVLILFDNSIVTLGNFDVTFDSKEDLIDKNSTIYKAYQVYFDSFFDNLGKKLRVIYKTEKATSEVTAEDLLAVINTLEDKFVIIDSNLDFKTTQDVASSYALKTGTEQKLILGYCPNDSYIYDKEKNSYQGVKISKFIYKYGNESYKEIIPAEVDGTVATSEPIACVPNPVENLIPCEASAIDTPHTVAQGEIIATRSLEPNFNPGYRVDEDGYRYSQVSISSGTELDGTEGYYLVTEEGNDGVVTEDNFTEYYEEVDSSVIFPIGYLVDSTGHKYQIPTTYDDTKQYYEITNLGANRNTAREGVIYCIRDKRTTEKGYLKDGTWEYQIHPTIPNATIIHTEELNTYIAEEVGRDYSEDNYCKGIEMSIAAYLTNIDITRYDSVRDYDFTNETYTTKIPGEIEQRDIKEVIEVSDNKLASALININANFVGKLLDAYRNIGGNDSSGHSIINMFMLICLHQTLTERLTALLITKIKYNQSGLAQVSAVLNKELQKYVDNGYLTTNKTWNEEDLYYRGVLIIKKNTPLLLGYKYVILPFSTLSEKEKEENALPEIYILIADSYGIRKINISGKAY